VGSVTPSVGAALAPRVSWNSAESRSIEFVIRNLIPGLIGEYGSNFWGRHVMQMGHHEAAVKHALAALGAVHETRDLAFVRPDESLPGPVETSARRFALQQYNESIQQLGQRMKTADISSTRTALVCCLIFLTLELLQRNNDQAFKHLRAGIKIYRSRMPADAASGAMDLMETSEDGIGELFYRLDSQATGYLDTRIPQILPTKMARRSPSPPHSGRRTSSDSPVPTAEPLSAPTPELSHSPVASIVKLRARLEDLHKQCLVYLIENQMYRRLPRSRVPEDIVAHHQFLLDALQALGHSLEGLAMQFASTPMSEQFRGVQKLVVAHRALSVMIRAHHVDLPWDAFDPEYTAIIEAAEPLFPVSRTATPLASSAKGKARASTPRPPESLPPFTLDATIVPSLFMTAHGAPSLKTRRRAAALLRRANLQEGLWNSEVAADIADKCLEDEVGRLSPPVPENIPQLTCRLGVDETGGFEPMRTAGGDPV
jgi:Fungal specific transcription factor domain